MATLECCWLWRTKNQQERHSKNAKILKIAVDEQQYCPNLAMPDKGADKRPDEGPDKSHAGLESPCQLVHHNEQLLELYKRNARP